MYQSFVRRSLWGAFFVLASTLPLALQAQVGTISGTVTDRATGEPISAVQLTVEGTGIGGLTAADGTYNLSNVPAGTHAIAAQRIGFTQERTANITVTEGETTTVSFTMAGSALALQGIVATGLVDPVEGVRSPITVGRITREQLQVPVAGSALANISGRVAGVNMSRSGGQPGEESQVQLRTVTSALSGTDPLFVVDGVILGGNTVNLDSQDIESIEVIKGAAAASLYGSRAAAGVIAITTNRGQGLALGETRFSVQSEVGIQQANRGNELRAPTVHPFLMTEDLTSYADAQGNPVSRNERVRPTFAFMDKPYPGPTFDNFNTVFQPGIFQTHNVSLQQNTEDTNFAITYNRYVEGGALENNDGYERNSFRVNIDHRFLETLSVGVSAFHSRDFRDDLSLNFTNIIRAPVDVDLSQRDENGEFIRIPDPNVAYENPLWTQASRESWRDGTRTLASGQFRWDPLSWMSLQTTVSYDHEVRNTLALTPKGTPVSVTSDAESDGSLATSFLRRDTGNAEVQLTLRRDLGDLNLRGTFRGLGEVDRLKTSSITATDFFVGGVPQTNAASRFSSASSEQEINALGFLWDTALDYDGKYILTALVRYDGSSLFGSENRWHPYYRFAGAWRMGQEDWFNVRHVDEFRLRYARGTAGGRPSFAAQYETWNVSASGVSKGTLGNVNLAPELTTEQEIAISSIIGGRLSVDLVYAWQETQDQILLIDVPSFTGFSQQWANGGTILGNTWELTLEGQVAESARFGWNSTFVFDRSKGKVGDWPGSCVNPSFRFICEGESLGAVYAGGRLQGFTGPLSLETHHGGRLLAHANKFDINDDGYLVYVGEGGSWTDGNWGMAEDIEGIRYEFGMTFDEIDEEGNRTRPKLGNIERLNFGWINNFSLGNQLMVMTHLTAAYGGDAFSLEDRTLIQSGQSPQMDQSGKPENMKKPMEYYESLVPFGSPQLQSTDFLKVRLVGLNYQLSASQINNWGMGRVGIRSMNVGLLARDLFTFTSFEAHDPEFAINVSSGQVFSAANVYPPTRTFTAQVQVGF